MAILREWIQRILGTMRSNRRDEDLAEELRLHTELAAEAGRAARVRAGGSSQAMDALRDQRGLPWLEHMAADVKHASRTLWRSPAFTIVGVATLALGMAAAVGIFSVLDQVVLRPLPYPDVARLVRVESPVPGVRPDAVWNLSTAEYFYFRREARTLDRLGVYTTQVSTVGAQAGQPESSAERALTTFVSWEIFDLLGARPIVGRMLTEADQSYDPRSGAPAAIISERLWKDRFGGSADVVDRTITLDERAIPIAGVVATGIQPPDATFLSGRTVDVWLPLSLNPNAPPVNQHTYRAIARLAPRVDHAAAQEELDVLTRRLPEVFPAVYTPAFMKPSGFSTAVVPLRDDVLGATTRTLWVLAAAISLLFVIAAANVTNLFVLHAETRRQELATRLALGATRARLARYIFAESFLLSVMAALMAAGLAFVALRMLVVLAPENIPRLGDVTLDWRSGAAAAIATFVAAVCFASVTMARFSRGTVGALRRGAYTTTTRSSRTRSALVVAQVAMSVVLACGAALMAQSVSRLLAVDPGFDPTGVVTASVMLPRSRYRTEPEIAAYHRELAAMLEGDHEIDSVSAATTTPLDGNDGCSTVFVQGRSRFVANGNVCVDVSRVTPGYFDTMGIRVRGRVDDWRNRETGGVVVSESAARRIWPGEDPIGKGLRVNGFAPPFYEVVGVADDVRRLGFDRPAAESVYFPAVALEGAPIFQPPRFMRVVLRTRTADRGALIGRVRSAVTALDRNVPIVDVEEMETLVTQSMARSALAASLLAGAAGLALVLSAVGLYGVISYGVASRQRELGVRLAIGAAPAGIRAMVLRETVALVVPGLAIGALVSLSATPLLEGLLFGIAPRDLATLVAVSGVLLLTGVAAGALPAWRASSTDPLMALRCE